MTPQVYENIEQLTYGELIEAISNIKEKIYNQDNPPQFYAEYTYYTALMQELDKRQKD